MSIVARSNEINKLDDFMAGNTAKFMALYGRRRVGKTYLIETYFYKKNCIYFQATGIKKAPMSQQIEAFCQQIARTFYTGAKLQAGKNWYETFEMLNSAIENAPNTKKIILFLDELPWMATNKSALIQALEYYWNRFWHSDKRIRLIVCGSSASWIIKKIINNTAGLYQRVTDKLELRPFNLAQTKQYLTSIQCRLNYSQIVELYMAVGGIPLYLSHAKKGLSASQIIDLLCFSSDGFLVGELEDLFISLYDEADVYIDIMRAIANKPYGVSKTELSQMLKISDGGTFNKRLKELEECSFIIGFLPYGHQARGEVYKIIDEYSNFYFKWIEPIKTSIAKRNHSEGYWLEQSKTPAFQVWAGMNFEALCFKHIKQIKQKLHLSAAALPYGWRYVPKNDGERGTQIDLLFDRPDSAITLCEIKYSNQPYLITKSYAEQLQNKTKIFQQKTATKKQLFMAMIAANGLKSNRYADELITNFVTLEDLFVE